MKSCCEIFCRHRLGLNLFNYIHAPNRNRGSSIALFKLSRSNMKREKCNVKQCYYSILTRPFSDDPSMSPEDSKETRTTGLRDSNPRPTRFPVEAGSPSAQPHYFTLSPTLEACTRTLNATQKVDVRIRPPLPTFLRLSSIYRLP
jgi:hypothetical protein